MGKTKYVIPNSVRIVNGVRNLLLFSTYARSRSLAFARDDSTRSICGWELSAKFNEITDEEFCTFQWVRCRSGAPDATQPQTEPIGKSIEIMRLESLCDKLTWQWVCNHSQ